MNNSTGLYTALSALVSAIGTRERNDALLNQRALDRLREGRVPMRGRDTVKAAMVGTSCRGEGCEAIIEVELGKPAYLCDLCMDAVTR